MQKVGILGGGQLGRMLLQAAANYAVETYVLENDEHCPAAHLCHHFTKGDIRNYDDVFNFGKNLDALTIEIESVNVDALEALENKGVRVFPATSAIRTIKNKITQKKFYRRHKIPTSEFIITKNKAELLRQEKFLPAIHKLGEGGYDGRGVEIIRSKSAMNKGFDAPAVLEKLIDIQKEIAVIVAKSDSGETAVFTATEMIFDPKLNLLDYQISPAQISKDMLQKAESIAQKVVENLHSSGLFAVELFIDKNNEIWVNETAPRVHNSGHHTIEANYCSQYDMLWRIMLQYPLGNTAAITGSAIVNILGAEGFSGAAKYEGLNDVLKMKNAFVHLYGKAQTKPARKMGHVTLLGNSPQELILQAKKIKKTLKIIA